MRESPELANNDDNRSSS